MFCATRISLHNTFECGSSEQITDILSFLLVFYIDKIIESDTVKMGMCLLMDLGYDSRQEISISIEGVLCRHAFAP